ncbi:hypothetical protein [Mitsuaria sp. 7]|uniref:hypothetical protein n=1 Tax=Mitsuaria sp. 7 TaxID=1658665 RepID=UPI0012FC61DC|nr:hypothetical protein [Mitsuaria sp. 7]
MEAKFLAVVGAVFGKKNRKDWVPYLSDHPKEIVRVVIWENIESIAKTLIVGVAMVLVAWLSK